ncbi:MAG: MASE1 domain-containing protein [Burkholderiales bacterium]|nr:MASE1 domain-containing protein [Opitutaceae bacterium]
MILGRLLWPAGLAAGTENLFWPATAVHVAGLARLGFGAWPSVLLATLAGQLTLGLPVGTSLINAVGNLAEALVVVLALRLAGVAERPLHTVRGASVFLGAALLAPLCSSIPGAATLLAQDRLARADYWAAVGVWSFANSASIVLLAPALLMLGAASRSGVGARTRSSSGCSPAWWRGGGRFKPCSRPAAG